MKKNAIIVASILFAGATAAVRGDQQSEFNQSSTSTPTVSSQYDPATGNPDASVSENVSDSGRSDRDRTATTSVDPFHADSSVRGGSNEARGVGKSGSGSPEGLKPLNPSMQADSSIRGGSREARGAREREWNGRYEQSGDLRHDRFSADSSIRGGSNEARYPDRSLRGSGEVESDRDDFGQGSSQTWTSDKSSGSVRGSANWNPSDDLLKDGTQGESSDYSSSVGGAARSEIGTGASSAPLDDMDVPASGSAATYESGKSRSESGKHGDLNSSKQLEKNIAGEYQINNDRKTSGHSADSLSEGQESTGSVQGGSIEESQRKHFGVSLPEDTELRRDFERESVSGHSSTGYDLFRNNRAQGVGSAAAGEYGLGSSADLSTQAGESDLAQRVKATLTRESTGTFGMTEREVARNIKITSHGGTVTLTGTVPSEQDKKMIEVRAREIRGVNRVDNQLTVAPASDPSFRNLGHDLEDATDRLQDIEPAR